jgi:hypothetical protein
VKYEKDYCIWNPIYHGGIMCVAAISAQIDNDNSDLWGYRTCDAPGGGIRIFRKL